MWQAQSVHVVTVSFFSFSFLFNIMTPGHFPLLSEHLGNSSIMSLTSLKFLYGLNLLCLQSWTVINSSGNYGLNKL